MTHPADRPPGPTPGGALDTDTIAAIATPIGRGGIGVVRVSGSLARGIGERVTARTLAPRTPVLATFRAASGDAVDQGIALLFSAPASFTGEDVLELQGHGGPVVMHQVLRLALDAGARLARPGEFSERAFLNGKLDLAQAEAIADLIDSGSAAAARSAMASLGGAFSERVEALSAELRSLRVYLEASLDFPEDEIDLLAEGQIAERVGRLRKSASALTRSAEQGRLLAEGATIVLTGAPNVGKSSLLNALAGEARAIVTDMPGTTRDVLPVDLVIDGLPVRLVDTAGIRRARDPAEREGVRRAEAEVERAHLVVEVVDARDVSTDADEQRADDVGPVSGDSGDGARRLVIANKVDLAPTRTPGHSGGAVFASATTGAGLGAVREAIKSAVGYVGAEVEFVARERHIRALLAVQAALGRSARLLTSGTLELVADELGVAHRALGQIVGTVSSDELLGDIFSSFCIGK